MSRRGGSTALRVFEGIAKDAAEARSSRKKDTDEVKALLAKLGLSKVDTPDEEESDEEE